MSPFAPPTEEAAAIEEAIVAQESQQQQEEEEILTSTSFTSMPIAAATRTTVSSSSRCNIPCNTVATATIDTDTTTDMAAPPPEFKDHCFLTVSSMSQALTDYPLELQQFGQLKYGYKPSIRYWVDRLQSHILSSTLLQQQGGAGKNKDIKIALCASPNPSNSVNSANLIVDRLHASLNNNKHKLLLGNKTTPRIHVVSTRPKSSSNNNNSCSSSNGGLNYDQLSFADRRREMNRRVASVQNPDVFHQSPPNNPAIDVIYCIDDLRSTGLHDAQLRRALHPYIAGTSTQIVFVHLIRLAPGTSPQVEAQLSRFVYPTPTALCRSVSKLGSEEFEINKRVLTLIVSEGCEENWMTLPIPFVKRLVEACQRAGYEEIDSFRAGCCVLRRRLVEDEELDVRNCDKLMSKLRPAEDKSLLKRVSTKILNRRKRIRRGSSSFGRIRKRMPFVEAIVTAS